MLERMVCGTCSAPIAPGHAFCPECGAAVGDASELAVGPAASSPNTFEPSGPPLVGAPDPRLLVIDATPSPAQTPAPDPLRATQARDAAVRAAAAARQAAAEAAAATAAAVNAAGDDIEDDADGGYQGGGAVSRPGAGESAQASTWLAPSATHRTLGSIGGRPAGATAVTAGDGTAAVQLTGQPRPLVASDTPASAIGSPAGPQRPGPATQSAGPAAPATAPDVPVTSVDRIRASMASIAAEPKAELATEALTALGGAIVLISFFLPWAAANGLGIGTVDVNPRPGAWAFDTAGGWPLFFVVLFILSIVLVSDRLEELMPPLASTIRRLTEVALPMVLGGILLGVSVMYQSLPWGCGAGILPLMFGAALLIAGSIVGLFFPAADRSA